MGLVDEHEAWATNLLLVLNKPNSTEMTPAKFTDDEASPLVKDITNHKRLVATRPILLGAFFFIKVYMVKQKPEAKLVWEHFRGTMYHKMVPTLAVEAKWERNWNILWNYVSLTGWRTAQAAYATHANIITMVKPQSSKVRRDTKDVFMKACNGCHLCFMIISNTHILMKQLIMLSQGLHPAKRWLKWAEIWAIRWQIHNFLATTKHIRLSFYWSSISIILT